VAAVGGGEQIQNGGRCHGNQGAKNVKFKQSLGDLLFLLCFLLLFLFLLLLLLFFLSAKHELVHGRSQELEDRIS
jgi:hypothetical protein